MQVSFPMGWKAFKKYVGCCKFMWHGDGMKHVGNW